MATKILVGDTIRIQVTFRNWSSIGDGEIIDPDRVTVDLLDAEFNRTPEIEEAVKVDSGVYYFDWTPLEQGVWYVEFVGKFYDDAPPTWDSNATYAEDDIVFHNEKYFIATANYVDGDEPEAATPNNSWSETSPPPKTRSVVREKFEVQKVGTGPAHAGVNLGEDQELIFSTVLTPLYVDVDEMIIYFPEASQVEIMQLINRHSTEIAKLFNLGPDDEPSFLALEYIRASVLCGLSRIYDYGAGGQESSLTLGDLSIVSRSYPRSQITRANAVNFCELAAALRTELFRRESPMKAVVKGTKYRDPMPKRHLRSRYGGNGRGGKQ